MNGLSPKNILIVDDEVSILKMLHRALSRKSHQVDTAINGEEGIKKIASSKYELVITDILMPGLSGKDLASHVKTNINGRLPVIGMSGTPWMFDSGVFDFVLAKPFSIEDLFDVLKKLDRAY